MEKTLSRLASINRPPNLSWEVIVVNNNCTDNTDAVVSGFTDSLPVRVIREEEQGLSAARNRGIQSAEGELILWTDDDVLVGDDWLLEYSKALDDYPQAAFFGGPIEPWFDGVPPAWLAASWRMVQGPYAILDRGQEVFEMNEKTLPYGANFAVRRSVQLKFLFDTSFGRKGAQLLSGEETEVLKAIVNAGHFGVWLPKARVRHFIGRERQGLKYLRKYYYAIGRTSILVLRNSGVLADNYSTSRRIKGVPLWLIRSAATHEILYRFKRIFKEPDSWLPHLEESSKEWGMGRELFNRHSLTKE